MKMHKDKNGHYKLRDQVQPVNQQFWPTPSARDWRSGKASEETHAKNSRPLNEVVTRDEILKWPTTTAVTDTGGAALCKWGGSGSRQMMRDGGVSEKELNGALNPDWVEWLMGWPIGWTSLEPLPVERFLEWLNGLHHGGKKSHQTFPVSPPAYLTV